MTGLGWSGGNLRLSDAERDEAARSLAEHYAVGRLDADELEDRQQAVSQARVRADLPGLFADLPGGSPVESPSPAKPIMSARWTGSTRSLGARRTPQFRPPRGRLSMLIRVLAALLVVTVVIDHIPLLVVVIGALWLLSHLGRARA